MTVRWNFLKDNFCFRYIRIQNDRLKNVTVSWNFLKDNFRFRYIRIQNDRLKNVTLNWNFIKDKSGARGGGGTSL